MQTTFDYTTQVFSISLETLMEKHNMSVRVYNVCGANSLLNLGLILQYWNENKSFCTLKSSGKKTELELLNICKFYVSDNIIAECSFPFNDSLNDTIFNNLTTLSSISLETLMEKHSMSVRAYNVCGANSLLNLGLILQYWNENKNFSTLENSGKKTELELLNICKFYVSDNIIAEYSLHLLESPNDKIFNNLTKEQTNIVNIFIKRRFQSLSIRAVNALNTYLKHLIDFKTIKHAFFNQKSVILKIENIGTLTNQEILDYIDSIESYALSVAQIDEKTVEINCFTDTLTSVLDLPSTYFNLYINKIQSKQFPLFAFLQQLLAENRLLSERDTTLLRYRFGYFNSLETITLDELGEQVGVTRERVRQIVMGLERNFAKKLVFLNHFKEEILKFSDYRIDFSKDCVSIKKSQVDNINQLEGCQFTAKFISKILSYLHIDTHVAFGEKLKNFENIYIIRRSLMEQYDFLTLFENITLLIEEVIKKDYTFDCDGYLYSFLKIKDITLLPTIKQVCMNIISSEYTEGVEFDFDGNFIFKRNKEITQKITQYEYIYEILEEHGNPMSLPDIITALNKKYSQDFKNIETMRTAIRKEKNVFIYFGRTSTYGLLKWEKERAHIKGGTIRDITEEYLEKCTEPKHFLEIAEFVMQYRPNTNLGSVKSNIQAGGKRFRPFKGGFWGLQTKKYLDTQFKKTPKILSRYLKDTIDLYPDMTEADIVAFLSIKYGLREIQVIYFINRDIKEGTLRRENNKIIAS